jgi:hypothetical protein
MNCCYRIRSMIDEADHPDAVSREASEHLSVCEGCLAFAEERAKLRSLLGTTARVTAPLGFDALLNERLRAVRERGWRHWLTAPAMLRFGAAAACLALAATVAQYGGLFGGKPEGTGPAVGTPSTPVASVAVSPAAPVTVDSPVVSPAPVRNVPAQGPRVVAAAHPRRSAPRADFPMLLLRDQDNEIEVPIMTVSVGLQQHVLQSSRRPAARLIDTY